MEGLKVLHITTEKTWRGGENQVRYLMEGLRRKGVTNFAALQPGARAHELYAPLATIDTFAMRNDLDLLAVGRILRFVRREGIHMIHTHTARAHSLGLIARNVMPSLALVVHRRVESPLFDRVSDHVKYLARKIDAYITVSHKIGDDLVAGGVPREKVTVVHSGIEESRFSAIPRDEARRALKSSLGIAPETPVIVTAAHLTPTKGYPVLLKAAALLKQRGLSFVSLVLGEGHQRAELEALHASLGLGDSVRFLGFQSDVPAILRGADVMAHPALWEGLGSAIIEGIFAGCALIASAVGGIPEMIKHEETGLLVTPGQETELADGLARLLTDAALADRLRAGGLAWVRTHFSTAQMVEGNYRVYREVLSRRGIVPRPS